MKASRANNFGRRNGFLSNLVTSPMVTIETPNGTTSPDQENFTTIEESNNLNIGNRGGYGKTLTVK